MLKASGGWCVEPGGACNSVCPSDATVVNQTEQAPWHWEHRFPTDLQAARDVLRCILDKLPQYGWGSRDVFGIHLALEEALVNAMKHGNRMDPNKQVHLRCFVSAQEVWVQITDQGQGFDPNQIPDCTAPENLERPCGRGLMLMRNFMTQVQFNERGNQVTMIKRRSPSQLQS